MDSRAMRLVRFLTMLLLPLLVGCETVEKYSLTYRLWQNGDLSRFCEPAPEPNLALFEVTNQTDVLVEYDALSEKHSVVKRQAYFLWSNRGRVSAGKKPKWAQVSTADQPKSIPVLACAESATNLPPELKTYATTTHEGRGFDLCCVGARSPESFDLPTYPETSGTPLRLVLTPLAVAGDTVMVGGVAAVVGLVLWAQSGAPTH